jgi:hypothetical protein
MESQTWPPLSLMGQTGDAKIGKNAHQVNRDGNEYRNCSRCRNRSRAFQGCGSARWIGQSWASTDAILGWAVLRVNEDTAYEPGLKEHGDRNLEALDT